MSGKLKKVVPTAAVIFVALSLVTTGGALGRCASLAAEVVDPFGCVGDTAGTTFQKIVNLPESTNTASLPRIGGMCYDDLREGTSAFEVVGPEFCDFIDGLGGPGPPPTIVLITWGGYDDDSYTTLARELADAESTRERESTVKRLLMVDMSRVDSITGLVPTARGRDRGSASQAAASLGLNAAGETNDAKMVALVADHVLHATVGGKGGRRKKLLLGKKVALPLEAFSEWAEAICAHQAALVDTELPKPWVKTPDTSESNLRHDFVPVRREAPCGGPSALLEAACGYSSRSSPTKPEVFLDGKGTPKEGELGRVGGWVGVGAREGGRVGVGWIGDFLLSPSVPSTPDSDREADNGDL